MYLTGMSEGSVAVRKQGPPSSWRTKEREEILGTVLESEASLGPCELKQ